MFYSIESTPFLCGSQFTIKPNNLSFYDMGLGYKFTTPDHARTVKSSLAIAGLADSIFRWGPNPGSDDF